MKKKFMAILLSCAILASQTVILPVFAEERDFKATISSENLEYDEENITAELAASGTYYEDLGLYFNKETGTITDCDTSIKGEFIIPSEIDGVKVTEIGSYAFASCQSLTSIEIPSSVTKIRWYAFYFCKSLTSATIPNSVTEIGDGIFSDCESLTSINVDKDNPNYLSIDGNLFNRDKTELIQYAVAKTDKEYAIPNSVTKIGNNVFMGCKSLTSVTIPSSVTEIGNFAFCDCKSLTSVSIPNRVTRIENNTFCNCASLTSLTIPNSITYIGNYAFSSCKSLTNIIIPNSVTNIGNYAFNTCKSLTSIIIPKSVKEIGYWAFHNCKSLASINVDEENPNYSSIDGNLFNKDKTELIQYAIGKTDKEYTIPNSVTNIGNYAFEDCDSLTSVTIPNSVTYIGWSAFYRCDSLTSVTIPNSVTYIEGYTFYSCDSLTSVTIPNSVTEIESSAFEDCESLTDVYYMGTESEWNEIHIGRNNEYLTNATIRYNYEPPKLIDSINGSREVIGDYAEKVQVECTADEDNVTFTITPKTENVTEFENLKLFVAGFDENSSELGELVIGENSIKDGVITLEAEVPDTVGSKIYIWDENLAPLMMPIIVKNK